jgi:RNA polymerase sigma-70 factor (ECF subfamily)
MNTQAAREPQAGRWNVLICMHASAAMPLLSTAPRPAPRPAPGRAERAPATRNLPRMNDVAATAAEVSDDTLMLAYAAGDVAAFDTLYGRHRQRLYRFLLGQLRNGALADELFQDIWQRVISARQGWKPDAPFPTWLYRIAHNRLTDHWRAQSHRPPAPIDADERTLRVPDDATPERELSDFEQRRRLQLALDELPVEQREIIVLRLEQELTLEEIGEITGVGRETVKSRLRYAMDKLRARLNE